MIVDEQPVANIEPSAIDRHRLAREPLDDGQRDELLRELVRPVIVRAIGEQDRQPIGVAPGPHEMVRRRLGGGIGRARIVAGLFGEAVLRRSARQRPRRSRHGGTGSRCARAPSLRQCASAASSST